MGRLIEDLASEKPLWLQGTKPKRWEPISLPPPPPLDVRLTLALTKHEGAILVGLGYLLGFVYGYYLGWKP